MLKEKENSNEPIEVDSIPEKQVILSLRYFYFIIVAIVISVFFIVSRYYALQNNISELGYKYESLEKDISLVKNLEHSRPQTNTELQNKNGMMIVNYSTVELSSCQDIISAIQMLTAVRISKKCNETD